LQNTKPVFVLFLVSKQNLNQIVYSNLEIFASKIKELSSKYLQEFWDIRCQIHSNPELSFAEMETSKLIQQKLKELGIVFEDNWVKTGIVATLNGDSDNGKTIALRADMDALPIQEENESTYSSKRAGIMHACGHDYHTASLLGTAKILMELKDHWSGTIKLIFQPGEEVLPGGASLMINEGLFEKHTIQKILGQHVTPEIESGKVGFKSGMFMASTDEIHITATGKGGHAALPHLYKNPITALSKAILHIDEFYRTAKHPIDTVVAIGNFTATGATNVIPNRATALGTIRTFDENYRKEIHKNIQFICETISKETEVDIACKILIGYPFLKNDVSLTEQAIQHSTEFLGKENVLDLPLRMTAEDFAFYSQKIPACFYRIGTGNKKMGIIHGVHTSKFDVDKSSLSSAIALMTYIAMCEMNA
jgi:amidohydrolase